MRESLASFWHWEVFFFNNIQYTPLIEGRLAVARNTTSSIALFNFNQPVFVCLDNLAEGTKSISIDYKIVKEINSKCFSFTCRGSSRVVHLKDLSLDTVQPHALVIVEPVLTDPGQHRHDMLATAVDAIEADDICWFRKGQGYIFWPMQGG